MIGIRVIAYGNGEASNYIQYFTESITQTYFLPVYFMSLPPQWKPHVLSSMSLAVGTRQIR